MGTVVIKWECLELSERNNKTYIVEVSINAIYCDKYGWICDCGDWTTGNDRNHIPFKRGLRDIYQS